MGNKKSKRERDKERKRQITKSLKAEIMKRGDQRQGYNPVPKVREKTPSLSQRSKERLSNLDENGLRRLVQEKCLYSNIYEREGLRVSEAEYENGELKTRIGIELVNQDSELSYFFGFDLTRDEPPKILIHYSIGCITTFSNRTRVVNPKKFYARTLVDMLPNKEYRCRSK